jgi:hypothetical protein
VDQPVIEQDGNAAVVPREERLRLRARRERGGEDDEQKRE